MMDLHEQINLVDSNKKLAEFVEALQNDLLSNPEDWENTRLDLFLEAMAAWVHSMENVYKNTGGEFPNQPSWKMIADILYAAKGYE
ncbi:DUF7660 family protein [Methylovulum psychrotolerans]|nr:hypothetical protein [Methylovulum psychrotolerans]